MIEKAKSHILNLSHILNSAGFEVGEAINEDYSFSVEVKSIKEKVKVLVYYGKKGLKTVLQGNTNSELFKKVHQVIFGQTLPFQEQEISEPEKYIGVDESGKGDYFGPLVICGFAVNEKIKVQLQGLNVKDSKLLSDLEIRTIASELKKRFSGNFSLVQINPKRYNELYEKFKNLNELLAWGHSRCIENLLQSHQVNNAICDQFGNKDYIKKALFEKGKQLNLIQTEKAERFSAVAAASILARSVFINWIDKTSKEVGFKIPKGACNEVSDASKKIIEKLGRDKLHNFVKIHFKITDKLI